MPTSITIPDRSLRFAALQRPYVLTPPTRHLSHLSTRLYEAAAAAECRLRRTGIEQAFSELIEQDYRSIADALPSAVGSVLDIGCGVGGIDVALHRHFGSTGDIDFYLLDKTAVDSDLSWGFRQEASFCNSLQASKLLVESNGVPEDKVHTLEATPDFRIEVDREIDLVISLRSWGNHYPISTYLPAVLHILSDQGLVILDARRDTGSLEELEAAFSNVRVIEEAKKYQMVVASR